MLYKYDSRLDTMLFNKRFSLKTVYYRSFFLLIVIPILLVGVVTLGIIRYMMEKSAIANIQNAQASIETSLSESVRRYGYRAW